MVTLSNLHAIFESDNPFPGTTADCTACTPSTPCPPATVPITVQPTNLAFQGSIPGVAMCLVTIPGQGQMSVTNGFTASFQATAYFTSPPVAIASGTNATVVHNGALESIPSGQSVALGPGDQVSTATGGQATITFSDGSMVVLAANSGFQLTDPGSSTNPTILGQLLGLLNYTIFCGTRTPPCYRINIPTAVIGVRGTSFSVNVTQTAGGDLGWKREDDVKSSGLVVEKALDP